MPSKQSPPVKPPVVSSTSEGYQYVRCQRDGHDDTVYLQQLCAIAAGEDPFDVFSPVYDAHHKLGLPTKWEGVTQIDVPWNVELRSANEHRGGHMNGDLEESEVPLDLGEPQPIVDREVTDS